MRQDYIYGKESIVVLGKKTALFETGKKTNSKKAIILQDIKCYTNAYT